MTNKGKVSDEVIKQLKLAHEGYSLYKWTAPNGDDIVFRPITQKLFKHISELLKQSELNDTSLPINEINEKVFEQCVVWPQLTIEEKLQAPVGMIPSVVKSIQEKSGYVDVDILNRVIAPDLTTKIIKDFDFWGNPSPEEIEALKAKMKIQLFEVRVDRWVFVIRPLTRVDIQVITAAGNDDQLSTARAVTVWPNMLDWENLPAGVVDLLAQKAFEVSGAPAKVEVEEL